MQRHLCNTLFRTRIPGRWSLAPSRRWLSSESIQDSFLILGVKPTFRVDEDDLKQRYRKLMSEYHPDRNHHLKSDEQAELLEKCSAVTRAYEELTATHTRAAHLMALLGKPMTESLSQKAVGMEFLMSVMEIREAIDDVSAGSDELLRPFLDENTRRTEATSLALEDALEKEDLDLALQLTARLQYWNRVSETIREKMEHIGE
jgi:molecular chaperone HscB